MATSTATRQDTMLGRIVVEQGLCTRQELDDCLALQSQLQRDSNERSLAAILVSNGYVTPNQIARVKDMLEDQGGVQQIPGYQILSKLGAGAMATVFKARQISLDRTVAIKVLPKRLSENEEFVDRFYKEGKAAAKLNHPNIVGAFDVGEANGYHYFVMEYVEGQTVYDYLETGQPFPEAQAIDIASQVCRALAHAHAAGFIHRDVKPKNIMITPAGVVKLADMGLAREASDQAAALAEAGKAYGTPYYISPEQIRGELDIDFRADIYSLGATFYHMVTGHVPFEAPTPSAVMHKHLKEDLIPPDHVVTNLSAGVGEIIEVAMAKKRKSRYQSAEDMLTDLQRVAEHQPPLIGRRAYNLDSLADLEKTGAELPQGSVDMRSYQPAEATIDFGARPLSQRLTDPLVMALIAALGIALVIIVILIARG